MLIKREVCNTHTEVFLQYGSESGSKQSGQVRLTPFPKQLLSLSPPLHRCGLQFNIVSKVIKSSKDEGWLLYGVYSLFFHSKRRL